MEKSLERCAYIDHTFWDSISYYRNKVIVKNWWDMTLPLIWESQSAFLAPTTSLLSQAMAHLHLPHGRSACGWNAASSIAPSSSHLAARAEAMQNRKSPATS